MSGGRVASGEERRQVAGPPASGEAGNISRPHLRRAGSLCPRLVTPRPP